MPVGHLSGKVVMFVPIVHLFGKVVMFVPIVHVFGQGACMPVDHFSGKVVMYVPVAIEHGYEIQLKSSYKKGRQLLLKLHYCSTYC